MTQEIVCFGSVFVTFILRTVMHERLRLSSVLLVCCSSLGQMLASWLHLCAKGVSFQENKTHVLVPYVSSCRGCMQ